LVPQIQSFLKTKILGIGDTFAHISHTLNNYPKCLKGQVMYGRVRLHIPPHYTSWLVGILIMGAIPAPLKEDEHGGLCS